MREGSNPLLTLLLCLLVGFLLTLAMPVVFVYMYVTDFGAVWDFFDSPAQRIVLVSLPALAVWAFWAGYSKPRE